MNKIVNGMIVAMTAEEIAERNAALAEMPPAPPTDADRIAALEEQNEMLTECILELSELLYA